MAGAADSYTVNEDFALPTSVPAPTGFDMEEEATIPALQSETNYLSVALTDIAHGLVGQIGSSIPPVMRSTRSTAHTLSPSIRLQAKIYQGLAELYMDNGQLNEAKDALDEAARITSLDVETLFLSPFVLQTRAVFSPFSLVCCSPGCRVGSPFYIL
ncbi:hypothetical protein FGIG_12427 [Fasciola gigantica]|uniref:Uncharacterized protein n=1 Tax=Fasciola gigantica TaxID=46835 RepID=A0A504Z1K5_FASGI|nr:hypothetical protein FGIG_12427 [Fasciola gigantica]